MPTSASSSEGTPVAAPVAKGAAPPAEPKEKPPAAVASEQPTQEAVASDAQPTAADVLPKEEPQLDDLAVKEEPAEEVQAEAPEEEIAEPIAEEEAVKEEAPDFEGAAEEEQGPTPIDVDEEAAVHSSPVAEVVPVHSPASPDLSERAFSEPPERPEREGRLRVRPRILKPPSDLPPGTYPTVRVDRQGIWVLVSPAPAPPTSGVRDAEEVREAPAPIPGAADLDPYELPQAVWQDLAQAYAARPPSLDLATAPVVSDRPGERTEEGFRLGVGAFRAGEVIEARPSSPARSRSPRQPKEGAAPSAPSRVRTSPAPPASSTDPAPPSVPIAAASSPASPAPPPPPSVPLPPPAVRPPPATGAPTAAKGPPPKTAPTPPPQWAKEQAARRQEAEAKAKAAELASGSAEAPSYPEQGAHTIGAADRSRSPKVKAPPPGLDAKPVAYKAPPTARLREEQAREREAQAEAKAKEAQAQRLRDEAAAKPSTPAAPRLVGQRAPLSIVLDWHKTLDLGYDSRRGPGGKGHCKPFAS